MTFQQLTHKGKNTNTKQKMAISGSIGLDSHVKKPTNKKYTSASTFNRFAPFSERIRLKGNKSMPSDRFPMFQISRRFSRQTIEY